jgi:large subunit ribosomal protein L33
MAKKGNRITIDMESSANTGFRYQTQKNKRNNTSRIELKKYDPVVRKHVMFKEAK